MTEQLTIVLMQEAAELRLDDWVEAGQGLALARERNLRASGILVRTPRQRQQAVSRILREAPGVVFIAVGKGQLDAALAFLNEIRRLPERSSVVIGGIYGTLCCEKFIVHEKVDAIILGEWVDALAEYAEDHAKNGYSLDMPGCFVRMPEGWHLNEQRVYGPNLQEWPEPDLEDFRAAEITYLRGGEAPIRATRGFPFNSVRSTQPLIRHLQQSEFFYYLRPPERVVAEAIEFQKETGAKSFVFVDELFPWIEDWIKEFADAWRKSIQAPFRIQSAAEYVTENILEALRAADVTEVRIDVESPDEALRQRICDLNQTNKRIIEAVGLLHTFRVGSHLNLVMGMEGETLSSIRGGVNLAREARAECTTVELYEEWPVSPYLRDIEQRLATGQSSPRHRAITDKQLLKDIESARRDIQRIDSTNRAANKARHDEAVLDAMADLEQALVKSPHAPGFKLDQYASPTGLQDVIALRVPTEMSWEFLLPDGPSIIAFGILLEPKLAGERYRSPVSFSVLASQNNETFRLFDKIMIQALDPDSRRWHWFRIPITGVKSGPCVIKFENRVAGSLSATGTSDGEIWAGWARIIVSSDKVQTQTDESATHNYDLIRDRRDQ